MKIRFTAPVGSLNQATPMSRLILQQQRKDDACIALPQPHFHGLRCSHFARRYYGNRFCFLFLWLLRCFSSPGYLLPAHGFSSSSKGCPIWESLDLCLFSTPRSILSITTPRSNRRIGKIGCYHKALYRLSSRVGDKRTRTADIRRRVNHRISGPSTDSTIEANDRQ
ncbi:hypothetical protein H5410_030624 [Solanum commersonii]|uniref:Uncharacterized protein n=1 Tax=Solanum commersonii TaxID=4109 RepID=A0A9J5YJX0_SOLCO|nr:hypothetical protein H5410_030624 [Solanum commersonii]